MSKELAFERQNLPDGTPNPKYVDLLDEDKPIAGQKFACISFVLLCFPRFPLTSFGYTQVAK